MTLDDTLSRRLRVLGLVAIIMVVYIHAYNLGVSPDAGAGQPWRCIDLFVQSFFARNLCTIAVPLFFAVSGFLFFAKMDCPPSRAWFQSQMRKRVLTLLVPYLIWNVLGIAAFFVRDLASSILHHHMGPLEKYSLEGLLGQILLHPVITYQLWFLRDLMILVVCSPVIYFGLSRLRAYLLIPLFALWMWIVKIPGLDIETTGFLFFTAGACIALGMSPVRKPPSSGIAVSLLVLWAAMILVNASLHASGIGISPTLNRLSIPVGLVAIWYNYGRIFGLAEPLLLRVAPFTFFIYAAHEPILSILKTRLIAMSGASEIARLPIYLALPMAVIVTIIVVGYMLKTIAPRIYRVMTGGR